MIRQRLSLKARAMLWLAQREHSRTELRRKLLRVARAELKAREAAREESGKSLPRAATKRFDADSSERNVMAVPTAVSLADVSSASEAQSAKSADEASGGCADPERCVDALLDWLQANRYLSEARFVESRIHARAARYGNLRIRQELAQHQVTPDETALQALRDTELQRARTVWQRKFGAEAADAAERAQHMRFLAQRGFSADVVRRVVRGAGDDDL